MSKSKIGDKPVTSLTYRELLISQSITAAMQIIENDESSFRKEDKQYISRGAIAINTIKIADLILLELSEEKKA